MKYKVRNLKKFAPLLLLPVALGILFATSPRPTEKIEVKDFKSTIGWQEYTNTKYRFSFKYPEGELSDFHTEPLGMGTKKSVDEVTQKSQLKQTDPNIYNVKFGADAWHYNGSIEDLLEKTYILNTKGATKTKVIIGYYEGLRVTNVHLDENVYYQYNFFKVGDFIYSFNLFSDDPILIGGNQQLLDTIISTAKFY